MNQKRKKPISWTQSQLKTSVFQKTLRDLPWTKNLCFQCRGAEFNPGQDSHIPQLRVQMPKLKDDAETKRRLKIQCAATKIWTAKLKRLNNQGYTYLNHGVVLLLLVSSGCFKKNTVDWVAWETVMAARKIKVSGESLLSTSLTTIFLHCFQGTRERELLGSSI